MPRQGVGMTDTTGWLTQIQREVSTINNTLIANNTNITNLQATAVVTTANSNDAIGPSIDLQKSRGTSNTLITVNSADALGSYNFQGYDSAAYATGASVDAYTAEQWTSSAHGSYLTFNTVNLTTTTVDERMRITSEGLFGIGTQTPVSKVHVAGDTDQAAEITFARYGAAVNGNTFTCYKARGTESAPTALASGDIIGTHQHKGRAATGDYIGASILTRTTELWTDTNQGTEISFNTTLTGATGSAERLRINGLGQTLVSDGTLAAPGIAMAGDTDTGLYLSGVGELGIVAGGIRALRIDGGDVEVGPSHSFVINGGELIMGRSGAVIDMDNRHFASNGTAAAPSLSFISDTDTGIYSVGANQLGVSTGGVNRMTVSSTAVAAAVPMQLPSYTVVGAPAAAGVTGAMIYVTDESGGAVPAFSDGAVWRRVTDRKRVTERIAIS
jgi:hypothetical protein